MNRFTAALRLISALSICLLLAACAQTPRPKLPLPLQEAGQHNLKGIAAESRQKFTAAEAEFLEAYRLYSAVENYRGMVTVLVNCARLYRGQGDTAKTEMVLKQAVQLLPHTPFLETEVSFEMAKLSLAKGDHDAAINWVTRGLKSAAESDRGRMLNLLAMVHCLKNDLLHGKESAEAALKASRGVNDRREEANALRNLGDIAYAGNSFRVSLQMYEAALSIDKELALSLRISDDLRGIAKSSAASNDLEAAAVNYQRSASINMAERNFKRSVEDLDALRTVFERTNNRERLSETVELLEKVKNSRPKAEQR